MPILLLWIDVTLSADSTHILQFRATITSTQLVEKAATGVLVRKDTDVHFEQLVDDSIVRLIDTALHRHSGTPSGGADTLIATGAQQPTVFVSGWELIASMTVLRKLCPRTFTHHKWVHHRLMDMVVVYEFVQRWGSDAQWSSLLHAVGAVDYADDRVVPWLALAPCDKAMAVMRFARHHIFRPHSPSTDSRAREQKCDYDCKEHRPTLPPLLWLDLELTGLDMERDRPLELSAVVTRDDSMTPVCEQVDAVLEVPSVWSTASMDEWSRRSHTSSALLGEVLRGGRTVPVSVAEAQVLSLLTPDQRSYQLAGASVWFDQAVLRTWMSTLGGRLATHVLDTSVLLECCKWYNPAVYDNRPRPYEPQHRTFADVRSCLALLIYLRQQLLPEGTCSSVSVSPLALTSRSDVGCQGDNNTWSAESSYRGRVSRARSAQPRRHADRRRVSEKIRNGQVSLTRPAPPLPQLSSEEQFPPLPTATKPPNKVPRTTNPDSL